MALGLYVHSALANWVIGAAAMPPQLAGLFFALSSADPTQDGTGIAEPSPTLGYFRQSITLAVTPYLSNGKRIGTMLSNTAPVVFGAATGQWPSVQYGALIDSNGNFITSGPLGLQRAVPPGDTLSFGVNAFQFVIG